MLPFILAIFNFVLLWIKTKKLIISKLFMSFFISYFILQEGIFSKLFAIVNCDSFQFDKSYEKKYLNNNLGIECFDDNHYIWIFSLVIPSFIFYGLIVPISTLILVYYKGEKMNLKENIIKFDFLMRQPFDFTHPSFWLLLFFISFNSYLNYIGEIFIFIRN